MKARRADAFHASSTPTIAATRGGINVTTEMPTPRTG
jgi:hypothetical protein